ncbi:MAG: hypothetical protein HUJ60_01905, partial [Bacilli bacterium]|nr:hypothetical protein [Bacilli bacterium]
EDIPLLEAGDSYVKGLTIPEFQECARICEKLYNEILANGGYANNPFLLYRNPKYIPGVTKNLLLEKTETYQEALVGVIDALKDFNEKNGLALPLGEEAMNALGDFLLDDAAVLSCIPSLIGVDIATLDPLLNAVISEGKEYQEALAKIQADFSPAIFTLDHETAQIQYKNLESAFFLKKWSGQNKLLKEVRALCKDAKKYKVSDLPDLYLALHNIEEAEKRLLPQMEVYQVAFGSPSSYRIKEYDFAKFEERYLATKALIGKYLEPLGADALACLVAKTQSFALKGKEKVLEAMAKTAKLGSVLEKELGFDFSLCRSYGIGLEKLLAMSREWVSRADYLSAWCSLLNSIQEAEAHGLSFVLELASQAGNAPA